MRSATPIRTAKIGYMVISAIYCIFGIILIAKPELTEHSLCYVFGSILLVYGIIKIIGYLSKDLFRLAFQYDLALGAMMTAFGIIMLVHPKSVITFVCSLIGIIVVTEGLFKVQMCIDAKMFGVRKWWLILVLGILTVVAGLLLIVKPSDSVIVLMEMLGIALFIQGALNFCVALVTVKVINYQKSEEIESDYFEERKD